ncbi:MAG: HEAT repeat domain-containing protein [Planctomycetes bacterium]|nr:HEAT repeat domain-containing protein [Planctomycetota bacterium]
MSIKSNPIHCCDRRKSTLSFLAITLAMGSFSGCQDGPLYGLKVANPYFSMREWKRDEELGVTDHERRKQLARLAETIDRLPADRQQFWAGHLQKMLANDESAEMRRLVVQAAGRLNDPAAIQMIETGLDDSSVKVRMEACRSLGMKSSDEAARLLAATIGTDTSQDVKHSAMTALANHKSQIAIDSLRLALQDRNPATRDLAMESLRSSTGKNYGDDPEVWIAALDGTPTEEAPIRFADRIRGMF